MNITCTTEKLKNAVSLAERMTGKALTLPTLHAILLIASGNSIKIRSTNLNLGIEIEIPATVEEEGQVLIKGEILANVCNHLSDASEVRLTLDHDNLTIQTPQHTTVIKSLPADDFPTLPIVEGEQIELKTSVLQEGIRSVYFCAAITDIKPEIASIFMYSEGSNLCFVATDSFRLAEKKIQVKGIPEISKILIPFKNIADILRVLDAAPDTIRITYSRNQIAFYANGLYLTSRLIDGGFPPYQLIIPKETLTKVVLLKQELLNTLRLSTIFADKFFQVSFAIPEDMKNITLSSKNSDVGSSVSIVDAAVEGAAIEVDFNLKYFLDVFQALTGDSVSISFTQPNKPIVVKSVSDNSFLYLLMPTNR
ncbi:MAG: Beta sliding clamp [Candidatus Nomurabacteria bacterium]|nr:Beta sliding clamp [Candidatus Nomurabacteria bacterium]